MFLGIEQLFCTFNLRFTSYCPFFPFLCPKTTKCASGFAPEESLSASLGSKFKTASFQWSFFLGHSHLANGCYQVHKFFYKWLRSSRDVKVRSTICRRLSTGSLQGNLSRIFYSSTLYYYIVKLHSYYVDNVITVSRWIHRNYVVLQPGCKEGLISVRLDLLSTKQKSIKNCEAPLKAWNF